MNKPSLHDLRQQQMLLWASAPLLLFLLAPLVALLLRTSPTMFLATLQKPAVAHAIALSLETSLAATGLTIIAGTPVAYLLARKRLPGQTAIDTMIDLPMVLPPAVAGIALLMAFGRRGLFGQWLAGAGIEIVFTPVAVILAQLFIAAPFYVKAAISGFRVVNHEAEEAAMLDGASAWQVFRYVTLPLAFTALLGGAVMTWARATGEFGATIIFAGNLPGRTQTMPLAIYLGFELDMDVALTLSCLLLAIAFVVLFVLKRLLHGRLQSVDSSGA